MCNINGKIIALMEYATPKGVVSSDPRDCNDILFPKIPKIKGHFSRF